jgi:hypothetical protein
VVGAGKTLGAEVAARLTRPTPSAVAVRLNARAYDFAKRLVKERRIVLDDRDDWSEHRPSAQQENAFLEAHGYGEYGRWHLGIDDEQRPETKRHYRFPYGDFERVHRCGVLAAEVRAAQNDYDDIKSAAAHLHGMLEALG